MKRALALALLAACGGAADPELDAAKAQVRTLFDAIDRGDCATIAETFPTAADPDKCQSLLGDWRDDMHAKLTDVPEARRDGRDREAIIVRAIVEEHGAPTTVLLRVTRDGAAWRVDL